MGSKASASVPDSQRVSELLGARDLIAECEEMLRGEREHLTGMEDYLRQRLEYWQAKYRLLDRRRGERRLGERRSPERAGAGRRLGEDRRAG